MTTAPIDVPERSGQRGGGERVSYLSVVLDCEQLQAGGDTYCIEGVPRLVIGRGEKREFRRDGEEWVLLLSDARVSASHAELLRSEVNLYQLRDLESRNGTFVRGQRVTTTRLADGDVLLLGHTLLMFHWGPPQGTARDAPSQPPALRTLSSQYARHLESLRRVAPSRLPILFLGESGTGKELLARATHDLSRRSGAFVPVNCAALPASLTESLLFGHTRGAFSGAVKDEPGHVRAADRGTLFLDEVADLPMTSQGILLRVLQEQEVTPVGAARPQQVDVRFVTATHRDLVGMVVRGEFRQDLYARLAGFVFNVPPLRERRVDLGLILSSLPCSDVKLRPEAAIALMAYDWPLNVRELGHCLASAALLRSGSAIGLADLPDAVRSSAPPSVPRTPLQQRPLALSPADCALRDDLQRRLAAHSGNIAAVARDLGKARQQVYRWIRRFGLMRQTEPPTSEDDRE